MTDQAPQASTETGWYQPTADVQIEAVAPAATGSPQSGLAAPNLNDEIARIRAFRKPLGAFAQKLALEKRPGYHRHWFNDTAGRLHEATQNGWAYVTGNDGQPVKRVVGTGRDSSALVAYAMEIPEVFWKEDMDARHAAADERLQSVKSRVAVAPSGQSGKSDKGKFYDPHESGEPIKIGTLA